MYFIAVYGPEEKFLGWLDVNLELTDDKNERSGFSSKETAEQVQAEVEDKNGDWLTELVTE